MEEQQPKLITITTQQRRYASWMTDVFIYTIVLNLFVEYNDAIIIDSFTISIFTAVVLKVMLDLLTSVEHRAKGFVGRYSKTLAFVTTWAILFLSKFVILEVIDFVFGEHVELGHFLDVLLLVITMMVARELTRRVYVALGDQDGEPFVRRLGS